jgi:hypothetical protein
LVLVLANLTHQNPIKERWLEPSQWRQKGKAKERPKDAQLTGIKKKMRES